MRNNKLISIKNDGSGFTIVEILIATAVFAVMIAVLTVSILGISDDFFKGITTSDTQNTARNVINDLAQAIQFSAGPVLPTAPNGSSQGYCIGNSTRYSYLLSYEVEGNLAAANGSFQSPHGLVVDTTNSCASAGSTPAQDMTHSGGLNPGSKELLSNNMRLLALNINNVGICNLNVGGTCVYQIQVKIIYGDTAQITPNAPPTAVSICNLGGGQQFCAISQLTTYVQKRVQ